VTPVLLANYLAPGRGRAYLNMHQARSDAACLGAQEGAMHDYHPNHDELAAGLREANRIMRKAQEADRVVLPRMTAEQRQRVWRRVRLRLCYRELASGFVAGFLAALGAVLLVTAR
jgi:hypothetical protein